MYAKRKQNKKEKLHLLNVIRRGEILERVDRTGIQNRSEWISYEKLLSVEKTTTK